LSVKALLITLMLDAAIAAPAITGLGRPNAASAMPNRQHETRRLHKGDADAARWAMPSWKRRQSHRPRTGAAK
jgi:hypothetical protein